jgi:hypothetical protein
MPARVTNKLERNPPGPDGCRESVQVQDAFLFVHDLERLIPPHQSDAAGLTLGKIPETHLYLPCAIMKGGLLLWALVDAAQANDIWNLRRGAQSVNFWKLAKDHRQ